MPWYYGTKVLALWTNYQTRNAWAYFSGGGVTGWRKFNSGNDAAITCMMTICMNAEHKGSTVDINVNGSNEIIEIYGW